MIKDTQNFYSIKTGGLRTNLVLLGKVFFNMISTLPEISYSIYDV